MSVDSILETVRYDVVLTSSTVVEFLMSNV